jgi:hypothetical protein
MGVVLWVSDRWVFGGWVVGARLAIQMAIGALVYAVLVRWFRLQAWEEVSHILLEMGGKRSRLLRWMLGHEAHAAP